MESARILLLGLGHTALSALQSLRQCFSVVGVVRGQPTTQSGQDPVETEARCVGIPLFRDASPAAIADLVKELNPDCVVVSSYDRILGEELLSQTRFVNVHYSRLPEYRGRANVNWALINDEDVTAITIHILAPGVDSGNILLQKIVPIAPRDSVGGLYRRLNEIQRVHLGATVARYLEGYEGNPQWEADATYGCSRTPDDGLIDWTARTCDIDRMIRALGEPFPGAFGYLNGRRLTIWDAVTLEAPPKYAGRVPGRVIRVSPKEGYADVLTGDGVLRLLEVQVEGEGRVRAVDVIRSVKSTLSLRPVELIDRIRHLEVQVARLLATQGQSCGG